MATLGFPIVAQRLPTPNFFAGMVEGLPTDYTGVQQFIEMSIPTAGGNSDGPLIDTAGCVIGVVAERTFEAVGDAGIPAHRADFDTTRER